MPAAVVYCRVSSADQEERDTIQLQLAAAPRWCEAQGIQYAGEYLDQDVSGTIPFDQRPGGAKLLADLPHLKASGVSLILLYDWTRIGRTPFVLWDAVNRLETVGGMRLRSLTEDADTSTPERVLLLCIQSGLGHMERAKLKQRARDGSRTRAAAGQWIGGPPPLGYRIEGRRETARLAIDDSPWPCLDATLGLTAAGLARWIFAEVVGGTSLRQLGMRLDQLGIPSSQRAAKRSGYWHTSRLHAILKNPVYKGTHVYGRTTGDPAAISRPAPALVSIELWEKAQAALQERKERASRNRRREYLLANLVRCAVCGRTCVARTYLYMPEEYRLYTCTGRVYSNHGPHDPPCPMRGAPGAALEEDVWASVLHVARNPGAALDRIATARQQARHSDLPQRVAALKAQAYKLAADREVVIAWARQGIITQADLVRDLANVTKEQELVAARLSELEGLAAAVALSAAERATAESVLRELAQEIHEETPFTRRREVLLSLLRRIVVRVEGGRYNRTVEVDYHWRFTS